MYAADCKNEGLNCLPNQHPCQHSRYVSREECKNELTLNYFPTLLKALV